MATKPGDGKTNPFGDGRGGAGGGRAAPANLIANPTGGGGGGAKPRSLTATTSIAQSPPQAEGTGDGTINTDSVAATGLLPLIDPPQAEDIGTRALGQNAKKPFKLGG